MKNLWEADREFDPEHIIGQVHPIDLQQALREITQMHKAMYEAQHPPKP